MDQRLRELERRWRTTGAPADGAVYLRERLRAEPGSRRRIEAAAYAGDLAACSTVEPAPSDLDPVAWCMELVRRHGREATLAAALGALRPYVVDHPPPVTELARGLEGEGTPASAFEDVERWLAAPSPGRAVLAHRATRWAARWADALRRRIVPFGATMADRYEDDRLEGVLRAIERAGAMVDDPSPGAVLLDVLRLAHGLERGPGPDSLAAPRKEARRAGRPLERLDHATANARIRAVVNRAKAGVVAWALAPLRGPA